MLSYPHLNPIALQLGPLAIRWYSLAYIAGILLGWWIVISDLKKYPLINMTKKAIDDMVFYAIIGIILGGRLGFVLFYQGAYYLEHPAKILHLWEGGMSFHGGMLGFIVAFLIFARKYKVSSLALLDRLAAVAPIGIFLGRLANFVNGELFGRVTDSPLSMIFPQGGPEPRYPSQLFEATLEGVTLFCLLIFLLKCTHARQKPGLIGGIFLVGYAIARIICEYFREPDPQLGFLLGFTTMGQLLSIPMLIYGLYLIIRKPRRALA